MIKPIKNEQQYDMALERIYLLMQKEVKEGSKAANELDALSLLVKDYEHHPVFVPNPTEGIKAEQTH